LGLDTLYIAHAQDNEILKMGIEQGRVILTGDKELFKRIVKVGARGVLVGGRPNELGDLVDILTKNDIKSIDMNGIGSRCSVCNSILEKRTSDQVKNKNNDDSNYCDDAQVVPDRVLASHNQFFQCISCGKVYWEGNHFQRTRALARSIDAELVARACTATC
jgi:uncharacterized protein with PIN domain